MISCFYLDTADNARKNDLYVDNNRKWASEIEKRCVITWSAQELCGSLSSRLIVCKISEKKLLDMAA